MVSHANFQVFEPEAGPASVIDAAASSWAVIDAALELPATPQRRRELERVRREVLAAAEAAGFTEADLLNHLLAGFELPPGGRSRLRVVPEPGRG